MTTLRVIIDEMLAPHPTGIARYAEELTRELIRSAPRGCFVEGIVSASTEAEYASVSDRLPGLAALHKSSLARREMSAAWQHGFTKLPGSGMVHAPSLLAPLGRHDRLNNGDQIAVTIHNALPWTFPSSLSPRSLSWHKAMAKRAQKYADAIVVPTHSVADQLTDLVDFGDRIRVIGGAASPKITLPIDAIERATRLGLPPRYLLAFGGLEPHRAIEQLIRALALDEAPELPLLVIGAGSAEALAAVVEAAQLPAERVRSLGYLADADLAVALERAALLVLPSLDEGFGLPLVEAFQFGTPVVHSDAPALLEVAADSGIVVERDDLESYPLRLAQAISSVITDPALTERLRYSGLDRSHAFSWRGSAEKVWQLHADL
jgi:glycosyltransferase involved in cell wall biosynthesis